MWRKVGRSWSTGVACGLVALVALAGGGGCAATDRDRPGAASADRAPGAAAPAVIEPAELSARLTGGGRMVLLDVRPAEAYAAGHVAGAVRVDPEEWKKTSLAPSTGLGDKALWHARIGALGISGDDPVVLYDDGRMVEAARVWFILQHFGVGRAAVLNGGWPALGAAVAGGQVATSVEATAARAVAFRGAGTGTIGLVDLERVRRAAAQGDAQVLDVRTAEEYSGKEKRKNPRGGHLPGAINLSHKALLDEQGRLKPAAELARVMEAAGLRRGEPVIVHCESGGRASLAALAAEAAGYGPVMNYYMSFGEWSADARCPVEGVGE